MTTWGIDVSAHQSGANLATAKAAGCGFVFAKATEGLTFTDTAINDFRAQAKAAGLPLGAYHFARPQAGRTGAQEAAHFLSVYHYADGDLPPVLDLEVTSLTASQTVAFALSWLAAVENATGVRPYLYTYSAFAGRYLGGGTALAAYPLWLASYRTSEPPAPRPWSDWAIWQHTSSASVPGIAGSVDRNITHLPIPTGNGTKDWFDMATLSDLQTAVGAVIDNKLDDIATEVWNRFKIRDGAGNLVPLADTLSRLLVASDPAKLAAAVAAAIPPGQAVDQATLEAALRNVLGSLDGH